MERAKPRHKQQPHKAQKPLSPKKQQQQFQLTVIYGAFLAVAVISACFYYGIGVKELVFPVDAPNIDGVVSEVYERRLSGAPAETEAETAVEPETGVEPDTDTGVPAEPEPAAGSDEAGVPETDGAAPEDEPLENEDSTDTPDGAGTEE